MDLKLPEILAPAGDKNSFLAAVAAGADAVFCGLKIFSARMEAENFSIEDLAGLTKLARKRKIKVYVAFNSLIKETELEKVSRILSKLIKYVDPDALIIQDLSMIPLAQKAGFKKEFHLSTLGNLTFPAGLETSTRMEFSRVVMPREFTIDEIKEMALHTPEGTGLEVFIHGALCYSVSGRCYWSSWFGGKSALRGRCVQPCRRVYEQKGLPKRYFSCMDFSADVLIKVLKQIPNITAFKIEGRKKSPHYVYYTVKAYKLLRDTPEKKKEALAYLDYALGREFSHYQLLTQRMANPLDHESETGSGLFAGRVQDPAAPFFSTREALLPFDLLRIGSEDDAFHDIQKVTRAVPKKGKFYLSKSSRFKIKVGTPVYIIDRRGPELEAQIRVLDDELRGMEKIPVRPPDPEGKTAPFQRVKKKSAAVREVMLVRGGQRPLHRGDTGTWISSRDYSIPPSAGTWLWLDPVLFPEEEKKCADYISGAVKKGAKNFVVNSFWQISLFKSPRHLNIWAGPFCNIANSMTINLLKRHGFSGAVVSPELDQETLMLLPGQSELPLGLVIHGNWPLGISRIISKDLDIDKAFISPKGETAWISKHSHNYHVFPNWPLDLTAKKENLAKAGFSLFIHIQEPIPKGIHMKDRPGLWNWNLKLL
nr:U32 family peptidase [Desulfobacula sp.]